MSRSSRNSKEYKKIDDVEHEFLLELNKKYEFLPNGNNSDKIDAFLVVVGIVPKDQDKRSKSS